jgi:hypothetical protein
MQVKSLTTQIESIWSCQDQLFETIAQGYDWDHKHGADWTFADVPFHLAYCIRDLVIRPIQFGEELPVGEQRSFKGPADLAVYNSGRFAEKSATQTVEKSLADLEGSRNELRRLLAEMSDADLDRPAWYPFGGGLWANVRAPLQFCLAHDWSEFMQLRIHMGLSEPKPDPAITSIYVVRMLNMSMPRRLNANAANGSQFTVVYAFTDPGVTPVSVHVSDGTVKIVLGAYDNPDLILTQSAETFEKTLRGIQKFPDAIQTGAIQVNNFETLTTFGQLFPAA